MGKGMFVTRIFRRFESWIDPYRKTSGFRPPGGALGFIWFYVSQAKWVFLAMLVVGGFVAVL